ncbi:FYVE, RhoGEF and PH domain-containing protein 4-like [Gigantopelta aegis]|uniref:FYVE, RhoGEF and PH domain-containing protein 4-like n=1 Tax=Gigantopelta aegis TaxID=1735272 RepID=UPI001B88CD2B|nr:FYVE, RhoGEF and PH domain-containing protein 4-like [Gigantopelta aegis]
MGDKGKKGTRGWRTCDEGGRIGVLSGLADVTKKHKGSDSEGYLKEMSNSAASILQFHTDHFLPAMKTRLAEWKSKPLLGDVMKANVPFFKIHRSYTLLFEHVVLVIDGWRRDPKKFSSLIIDIKKLPECDNVPFQTFMWYPLKHLQSMEFFLWAYLKNLSEEADEAQDIKEALELLADAKEYPKKATQKQTMKKVKHDILQLTGRSLTPPPISAEEVEPAEEPPTPEVYPEDEIVPKDKVQQVVLELLSTERSYVRKLRLLQKIEERFRRENTIPDDVIKKIFSKMESIMAFHSIHLLPQIEERAVNW